MPRPLHALMLVGSYTTPGLAELSALYARGCEAALAGAVRFTTLHRSPGGDWRVVDRLDDLATAPGLSLDAALAGVAARRPDIGLPQMFCPPGMTEGRELFSRLGVPLIGNTADVMAIATDKARTRDAVAARGVDVPDAVRLPQSATVGVDVPVASLPNLPVVVKPVTGDNSDGLRFVGAARDLADAIAQSQHFGDVLVERFIPAGREVRCGVLEWDGHLRPLPMEEYPVGDEHPVRTRADKLRRDDGRLTLAAKTQDAAWIVGPDDPDTPAVQAAALAAFRALGCRHYGLFDFRIDPSGKVWFLEASLYCSFSPQSVLVAMASADGITLPELLEGLAGTALNHPSATAA